MAVAIPFEPSVPNYSFTCAVNGTPYQFRVRWNATAGAWYFDLREEDGTPIALGIKIVLGAYLGRHSSHHLFSEGVFVAVDRSGRKADAGIDDLGARVTVLYVTNAEVRAAAARMNADVIAGRVR